MLFRCLEYFPLFLVPVFIPMLVFLSFIAQLAYVTFLGKPYLTLRLISFPSITL